MKTMAGRLITSTVLCLVVTSYFSFAATNSIAAMQDAGKIASVGGQATLNGKAARVDDILMWNDAIKTDEAGSLQLYLDDNSLMTLGPSTEVRIAQQEGDPSQTAVNLAFGSVRRQVVIRITRGGGPFEVRTTLAVATAMGSDIEVFAASNRTTVNCYAGSCKVDSLAPGGGSIVLSAGQSATITPTGIEGPVPIPGVESAKRSQPAIPAATSRISGKTLVGIGVGSTAAAAVIAIIYATRSGAPASPILPH